jgi:hypothetical protein
MGSCAALLRFAGTHVGQSSSLVSFWHFSHVTCRAHPSAGAAQNAHPPSETRCVPQRSQPRWRTAALPPRDERTHDHLTHGGSRAHCTLGSFLPVSSSSAVASVHRPPSHTGWPPQLPLLLWLTGASAAPQQRAAAASSSAAAAGETRRRRMPPPKRPRPHTTRGAPGGLHAATQRERRERVKPSATSAKRAGASAAGSTCAGGLTRAWHQLSPRSSTACACLCLGRALIRTLRCGCSACCLPLSLCAPRPCCPAPRRLALPSASRAGAAPCRCRRSRHPLPPFQRGGRRWARRRTSCAWT